MSSRAAGVSAAPYDSLNLGFHVGDDPAAVRENRRRIARAVGLPGGHAVVGDQVHGVRVGLVRAAEAGRGWEDPRTALPATDALVTREQDVALAILVADCFPVAIWDAEAGVLAVAHCGWRGVAGRLVERVLRVMVAEYGAVPERCRAWIDVGIRPCCFEVGPDVVRALAEAVPRDRTPGDQPDWLRPAAEPGPQARGRASLPGCLQRQLVAVGIPPGGVSGSLECTSCSQQAFFSHRRATQRGEPGTGRQALIAWLE
jgi:YfiH family protein